jgi:hypothetical protein
LIFIVYILEFIFGKDNVLSVKSGKLLFFYHFEQFHFKY